MTINPDQIMIRKADLADIHMLAEIKKAVWPEETADPDLIAWALKTRSHQAFLARVDGEPAGFVSCFVTQSQKDNKRWEIDLLAVHPDFRRRGIANKLLATAILARPASGHSRALIAVDNIGSQKSFARHGFETDGKIHTLHISTAPASSTTPIPPDAHLVEVNTFNYQGIWIEGQLSKDAFPAAQALRQQKNIDVVGALIPEGQTAAAGYALAHGFEPVANFHWWTRNFAAI